MPQELLSWRGELETSDTGGVGVKEIEKLKIQTISEQMIRNGPYKTNRKLTSSSDFDE